MTAVSLVGLVKRYGQALAVDGISLEVQSGEFISLLGPSGCGKTTLLRILAGLDEPDTGRITLDGDELIDIEPGTQTGKVVRLRQKGVPHLQGRGRGDLYSPVVQLRLQSTRLVQLLRVSIRPQGRVQLLRGALVGSIAAYLATSPEDGMPVGLDIERDQFGIERMQPQHRGFSAILQHCFRLRQTHQPR